MLFCSMLVFHPQSGDSSDTSLGVRSVALLQVTKLAGDFIYLVKHKNWGFSDKNTKKHLHKPNKITTFAAELLCFLRNKHNILRI